MTRSHFQITRDEFLIFQKREVRLLRVVGLGFPHGCLAAAFLPDGDDFLVASERKSCTL